MSAAEIVLFESSDGEVTLPVEVDAAKNEVWLTQDQMAVLFDTTKQNVGSHLKNCFAEGELDRDSVVKDSFTTASDGKNYRVMRYSLDAILSVGYRVKSQRGVEFRKWATDVLRRYLTDGYAVNERRLRELGRVANIINRLPEGDVTVRQIVDIVQSYSRALDLLDDYDHQVLTKPEGRRDAYVLSYEECREVIDGMRFGSESNLFGVEKDDSFHASIGDIYAGFGGQDAYPSVEEKAANLLYFVVKNHSFLDGNKRIAAALFLYFLDRNDLLFDKRGNKLLEDGVLVALTIMMAESRPQEKEAMVNLTMNFLCR
ncbi:MAG: virulence protein RhuM/Fic/DOC family protein [Atopobiaceae bacterium]|nr:virulence protein RhuM/Fic/DOC family protein [Atopobiaceae bacterium]